MFRFLATCTLIAALCVGVVLLLKFAWPDGANAGPPNAKPGSRDKDGKVVTASPNDGKGDSTEPVRPPLVHGDDDRDVVVRLIDSKSAAQPKIFQEARILAAQRQDVPSERDGKLLFLGTPARAGEFVPKSKLIEFEVPLLAIEVPSFNAWMELPEEERLTNVDEPKNAPKYYRAVRFSDSLAPGSTVVVRHKMKFRKLEVGDRVKKGQLLGIINPVLAMEELFIRQAGVEIADREIRQSVALYVEYTRRAASMNRLRGNIKGGVTDDEYFATVATATKYKEEGEAKKAGLLKSQRELSQALTTLKQYLIRASIDGVIKSTYKHAGESVKNLEPVLQIQNLEDLRVEAQVEVQDALALRDRVEEARVWRSKARDLAAKAEQLRDSNPTQAQQFLKSAQEHVNSARALLRVNVEASRVEPPRTVLSGHLQEVTCVAVCGGSRPRIVSGSEDQTARIWEQVKGRWEEKARLDHHAIVRAVACTPPSAKRNLLLTATSTGRARVFDLDKLTDKDSQVTLGGSDERHSGSINAVAFLSEDVCATGGEDRSIRLWDTSSGRQIGLVRGAHQAGVTSLSFTAKGQLVSVGRDRRLVVWNVVEGGEGKKLEEAVSFERRSNEVGQLGADAEGTRVLFDEGHEIRVLSLDSRKIEGRLANSPGMPTFSTLALYSPDGSSILTNGNAAGRLQLWRAPSAKHRASELRNYAWTNGKVTSGAFDPAGKFAVTGTTDARVLVWAMPTEQEAKQGPLMAQLSYVEEFLDTSLKRVAVRATLEDPPSWVIPGSTATIVVPPRPAK